MGLKFTRNTRLCSVAGGSVEFIDANGETVAAVAVPAGSIPAKKYLAQVPIGGEMRLGKGVTAYEPPSAIGIARGVGYAETGANPDFQPMSNAQRLEEQLRSQLRQMSKAAKRIEARAAAFERMDRIQPAPEPVEAAEPVEVIEKEAKAE